MRGKVQTAQDNLTQTGIIPAHAGKSHYLYKFCTLVQDHPRSCGEKAAGAARTTARKGSSPLMRGKGSRRHRLRWRQGIIPAHAGKRLPLEQMANILRDHPRSCGEKSSHWLKVSVAPGSSPLMRGKARPSERRTMQSRIIPAHAGKSQGSRQLILRRTGSSPLMRGKVASIGGLSMPRGIIPAHAGKRPSLSLIADARGDHPRSCGEKGGIALGLVAAVGSSPLMRGKEPQNYAQHLKRGIIPAHAGKRDGPLGPVSAIRDHPRSCGEKFDTVIIEAVIVGSSPLMRGKEG